MVNSETNLNSRIALELVRVFFIVIPIVFEAFLAVFFTTKFCRRKCFPGFVFQVLFLNLLLILTLTIVEEFVCKFLTPLFLTAFVISTIFIVRKCNFEGTLDKLQIFIDERSLSVTFFRSSVNLITSCAILAVDFKMFPSAFRKSNTYGLGLMDTGIGLFVVSMAIVSKPKNDIFKLLKQSSALIVLGVIRTISINVIDYHQDER